MGSIGKTSTPKSNNALYSYNPDITEVTDKDISDMIEHTDKLNDNDFSIPKGIGSSEHFLEAMDRYFAGEDADKKSGIAAANSWFTKEEQDFIRNSTTTTNSPIYRIENSSWMGDLKTGQSFTFGGKTGDIRSFSTNSVAAKSMLEDGIYARPVIFQTTGKVKFFNAMPYTAKTDNWQYTSQYEGLAGGRWRVKKVDFIRINGKQVKRYTIEQL